jgi:hypothetical protein
MLDFSSGPELIELGYQDTLRQLDGDAVAALVD